MKIIQLKRIIFVIFILLLFFAFSSHTYASISSTSSSSEKGNDFKLQPGDIILTKGPVLFGFFGHSSIALDHDTVLQIEGPGDKPIIESFESFKQRFGVKKMIGLKYIVVSILMQVKKQLIGQKLIIKIVIKLI